MIDAKTVYKIAWIIWIIGSLLIVASWISLVPIDLGWLGFLITLIGVAISMCSHWLARQQRRPLDIDSNNIASLDALERILKDVTTHLDSCAAAIRDLRLDPETNIRRAGEAILLVCEIRNEIYKQRPDLIPKDITK